MSIHPSLSSSAKSKKTRSVLKRAERLKTLIEKDLWKEGQSIFALPKTKVMRIKIKKEKAAAAPAEETGKEEAVASEEAKSTPEAEKPTKPSSR